MYCRFCHYNRFKATAMNLQIRDPRARELAKRIAQRRHISMTEAVVEALEAEYRRVATQHTLAERLGAIADELGALAKPGGRDMTQEEIDAMWGQG
jgi:antitoxin VapB